MLCVQPKQQAGGKGLCCTTCIEAFVVAGVRSAEFDRSLCNFRGQNRAQEAVNDVDVVEKPVVEGSGVFPKYCT